eukprot:12380523-Alexandrium_andersonii.AAC.1
MLPLLRARGHNQRGRPPRMREFLGEHGSTAGCLKCNRARVLSGRVRGILRAAGDASIALADERINEHLVERVRAAVEAPCTSCAAAARPSGGAAVTSSRAAAAGPAAASSHERAAEADDAPEPPAGPACAGAGRGDEGVSATGGKRSTRGQHGRRRRGDGLP